MQIITKYIRWRALMETYQTVKYDRSPNNLSWDIVLTHRWPEQKKEKKRIRKAKTIDLHLHADLMSEVSINGRLLVVNFRLISSKYMYRYLSQYGNP